MSEKSRIEKALNEHVRTIMEREWRTLTAQPATQPLKETPWLRHDVYIPKMTCECGLTAARAFRLVHKGDQWFSCVRCCVCGKGAEYPVNEDKPSRASIPPPPAPNAVHERLERDGLQSRVLASCGTSHIEWRRPSEISNGAWFPCPCDACAKARGE